MSVALYIIISVILAPIIYLSVFFLVRWADDSDSQEDRVALSLLAGLVGATIWPLFITLAAAMAIFYGLYKAGMSSKDALDNLADSAMLRLKKNQ